MSHWKYLIGNISLETSQWKHLNGNVALKKIKACSITCKQKAHTLIGVCFQFCIPSILYTFNPVCCQ